MLSSLSIRNVVLIEALNLSFDAGLCALTGETGAGKSILLDSLGLALGERSDAALVRKNTEKATVTASFDVDQGHEAFTLIEEAGLTPDLTLILRRTVSAEGRSKAFINDQPVSVGLLKQVGESLLEIHGQFETRGLLDPSSHRAMLDEYAGLGSDLAALWGDWQSKKEKLERLKVAADKARSDEEYLRQAIEDLDGLSAQAGEEAELSDLRDKLMNREQVLEALNTAHQALSGDEDPVRSAWGALDRIGHKLGDEGQAIIDALGRASSEIEEALSQIHALSVDLQETEHSLETIDERLFALRGQARKHSCTIDELPSVREKLAEELNMIEAGDEMLERAAKEAEQARSAYIAEAKAVGEVRRKAAAKLDQLVAKELPPLKLERAKFVTDIQILEDESRWGAHGMDQVRFLVATNPGADPGALGKIASGGELSRFMLALKVVLAETGGAGSLIFDEVDAGIGGSTADAVGERLARLAAAKQILVVTHSPQVAARASHHYIVEKGGDDDVKTNVVYLQDQKARAEEIARMLAGATITQEARAAADKLLETA